ncbi:ribonuclease P/MRP protein subunit POP3 [Entomortierella parvispora]|uniref:Ribonuclease P/MRP protein subunit POP3 n=1 Tax=Entomortierella parvispora TaxID=205924 RepID=A0A9P3LUF2_9FUNG|nr:ribonuclease P/MRP protein subunit POP3 [Entomortierella parvispora]
MSGKQAKNQNAKAATFSGGLRSEAKKSKIVYKNVLDTPFNIPWPEVTAEDSATILDALCELLEPIGAHRDQCRTDASKNERSRKKIRPGKPNTALASPNHDGTNTTQMILTSEFSKSSTEMKTDAPSIMQSISIGINSVTKTLERSVQDVVKFPPPSAIFLCKGDLAPSHLYSHLGPMVAMVPTTLLFPLHKGSEQRLSKALGMKAVGAVAVLAGSKEAEDVVMILSRMVEPLSVPWLPKAATITPKKVAASKEGAERMISEPHSQSALNDGIRSKTDDVPLSTTKKETNSAGWIPTNIKSVKTTMPVVVRAPKAPKESDKPQTQAQPLIHQNRKGQQGNKRLADGLTKEKLQ